MKNPDKTDRGQLISSYQCDSRIADAEFLFATKLYQQKTGRKRGHDNVIAYHLRQSFPPGEITPEEANRLGKELAMRFTKGKHAFIVCTHIDRHHIHNHVIYCAVTTNHDRKFRDFKRSGQALRRLNDTICIENGYSIIENPKPHGKSYNKWLGDTAGLSHREIICRAIDAALAKKPASFEELLKLLEQMGYQVKHEKVLEKHIANYARTRPVYEAYRKAGYSKKFLAAHEGDIALHKEAKRFFDSLGIKKLPSTKTLHIEYAKLSKKKDEAYAEFRKRREDMKELLTAKANVDRILGKETNDDRTAHREKKTEAR